MALLVDFLMLLGDSGEATSMIFIGMGHKMCNLAMIWLGLFETCQYFLGDTFRCFGYLPVLVCLCGLLWLLDGIH